MAAVITFELFKVESVIEFESGLDNYTSNLQEMKYAQARVYLLYAKSVENKFHTGGSSVLF